MQMGRQLVGELVRIVELDGRDQPLEGQVMRQLGVLLEDAEDLVHVGLDLLVGRNSMS